MKSASQITVVMIVLAAISVVGAMFYYPWPEIAVADEEVGKPLFEEYSVDKVRGIDIVEINSESRAPSRIQLGRRAEKWVIPSRQNFVATNTILVGSVVNSLNERTVYEVVSENAQDHIQYGVVDPDEFSASQNLDSVGKKIILTDRNSKKIADLIIGSTLKDDPNKRYVRIPGKPRIYLIDINDQMLKTQFTYWVSPNPLQLKTNEQSPGLSINAMRIRKNQLSDDPEQSKVSPLFDAKVSAGKQMMEVDYLRTPTNDEQKPWRTIRTIPEQEARLVGSIRGLFPLPADDVRRKTKSTARALKKPTDGSADVFKDIRSFGFFSPEFVRGRWKFVAEKGSVEISTREGVLLTLSIGRAGSQNSMSRAKMNHFVMINAGVDHERLKEPQRPAGLADDDSEENKQFRRVLNNWNEAVKAAQSLADDMNALHSDWFYLVSEDIVKRLLPDITIPNDQSQSEPGKTADDKSNREDDSVEAGETQAVEDEKSPAVDKN